MVERTKFLTVQDVKDRLGIGINQTRQLVNRKDFPKIKIGRKNLIPEQEFEDWIHNSIYKEYKI